MAGKLNRLIARQVQTITKVGRHADGGGLYLKVRSGGSDKPPIPKYDLKHEKRHQMVHVIPGGWKDLGDSAEKYKAKVTERASDTQRREG
jgi:hypothetical protein